MRIHTYVKNVRIYPCMHYYNTLDTLNTLYVAPAGAVVNDILNNINNIVNREMAYIYTCTQ